MYSPKIDETLIPKIYKISRAKKLPMTKFVNQILAAAIADIAVETVVVKEIVSQEQEKETYVLQPTERSAS